MRKHILHEITIIISHQNKLKWHTKLKRNHESRINVGANNFYDLMHFLVFAYEYFSKNIQLKNSRWQHQSNYCKAEKKLINMNMFSNNNKKKLKFNEFLENLLNDVYQFILVHIKIIKFLTLILKYKRFLRNEYLKPAKWHKK